MDVIFSGLAIKRKSKTADRKPRCHLIRRNKYQVSGMWQKEKIKNKRRRKNASGENNTWAEFGCLPFKIELSVFL